MFGKQHFSSNPTNAFRHALWNVLISRKVNKKLKNLSKSAHFAKKFTDLYEKVTQNELLDEQMDLHNNQIGRNLFLSKNDLNESEIVQFLHFLMKKSIKITKSEDIERNQEQLVHITDLCSKIS